MKLSLSWALVLHALLVLGQILNAATGYVPAKYQFAIAGALGIVQLLVGLIQHYSPIPTK